MSDPRWPSVRLADTGTWLSGGTPRTSEPEFWGGDIPWISSKSLVSFRVRDSDRRVTSVGAQNGTRLVPRDSVLMVVRGMSLKSEFRMGITRREVAFGQDCKAILPGPGIDPGYLAYAIKAKTPEILELVDEAGHGTGRLQMDLLNEVQVVLPPLLEQQAIASVLSLVDDKLESNGRAQSLALSVAQCLLAGGGNSVRVGDVAALSRGLSYKGAGLVESPDAASVPMVNLANFTTRGWLKGSGLKYYKGDFKTQHVLKAGDLVLANTDLTQNRVILGRGALVSPYLDGCIYSHHTSVLKFQDPIFKLFAWAQLQSSAFRERAEGFATGTTVTALPKEAVLDFALSLPSKRTELTRVTARAEVLLSRVWALEAEDAVLNRAKALLLPSLMDGSLRPADPSRLVKEVTA